MRERVQRRGRPSGAAANVERACDTTGKSEIAADLRIPGSGTASELLARVDATGCEPIDD